jgi:hypothetical protein
LFARIISAIHIFISYIYFYTSDIVLTCLKENAEKFSTFLINTIWIHNAQSKEEEEEEEGGGGAVAESAAAAAAPAGGGGGGCKALRSINNASFADKIWNVERTVWGMSQEIKIPNLCLCS